MYLSTIFIVFIARVGSIIFLPNVLQKQYLHYLIFKYFLCRIFSFPKCKSAVDIFSCIYSTLDRSNDVRGPQWYVLCIVCLHHLTSLRIGIRIRPERIFNHTKIEHRSIAMIYSIAAPLFPRRPNTVVFDSNFAT